ncbi:MAG: Uma2 family endonuclease [Cyanobacteria bacterium CRU_2_1]|nr:Uma2 family endonuclease [Cyanobacteria bacterium RU_5_0]NJR61456.1 Uma2 family endonuclease [Cyanobacteria bacterium CRU_2_1]
MSIARDLNTPDPEWNDIILPPTDLESNEPPMETYPHLLQMLLLLKCIDWWWRDRDDYFAAGNLTIYYSPEKRKSEDCRGPDFFVVLGTSPKPRKSWIVWEEGGKYPNMIVELLSKTTAAIDKGLKKQLYQDIFRTPEYFWFDPETLEFAGFSLISGQYQPIQPNTQGWFWSQQLQLFLGIHHDQLRFFTASGQLVPIPEETALIAEQEKQRADKLAAKLRELGIDPDSL